MKRGGPLARRTPLPRTPFAGGAPLVRARTPKWGKSKRKTEADAAFAKLRPQVIAREGGCCALCGRETPLEVHHRLRRGSVDRERLSNLLGLCADHHREVHAKPSWSKVNGWILQDHQSPEGSSLSYRGQWRLLRDGGLVVPVPRGPE